MIIIPLDTQSEPPETDRGRRQQGNSHVRYTLPQKENEAKPDNKKTGGDITPAKELKEV